MATSARGRALRTREPHSSLTLGQKYFLTCAATGLSRLYKDAPHGLAGTDTPACMKRVVHVDDVRASDLESKHVGASMCFLRVITRNKKFCGREGDVTQTLSPHLVQKLHRLFVVRATQCPSMTRGLLLHTHPRMSPIAQSRPSRVCSTPQNLRRKGEPRGARRTVQYELSDFDCSIAFSVQTGAQGRSPHQDQSQRREA